MNSKKLPCRIGAGVVVILLALFSSFGALAMPGDLYVSTGFEINLGGRFQILKFSPDGTAIIFAVVPASFVNPPPKGLVYTGLAFNGPGVLYAACQGQGRIYKFDTTSATTPVTGQLFVSSVLVSPNCLTFDTAGDLFVSDGGTGGIYKISSGSSNPTLIANGLVAPNGLAFDQKGNLWVAEGGDGTITHPPHLLEFPNPPSPGQSPTVIPNLSLQGAGHLTFDSYGNLYMSEYNSTDLSKGRIDAFTFNAASGSINSQTTVISMLYRPGGIVFDSKGNLFVANYSDVSSGDDMGTIRMYTPSGTPAPAFSQPPTVFPSTKFILDLVNIAFEPAPPVANFTVQSACEPPLEPVLNFFIK
jgi:sugar lactone lactonase YvrE